MAYAVPAHAESRGLARTAMRHDKTRPRRYFAPEVWPQRLNIQYTEIRKLLL